MIYQMRFYCYKDVDGNIHVQNVVGAMLGQHHVHTLADFEEWRKPNDEIIERDELCDCGMKPGDVCDGQSTRYAGDNI